MGLYLLTGTPGQAKGDAAKKIAGYLRELGITVGLGDVEDELLDLFPAYKATSTRDPLVGLIGEKPPAEIKDRWPEAYKNAVAKATAGNPDVAIVVSCLQYYRCETYEFYSAADCETIKESSPRRVLTLIDDIYEVYYRLSRPGQVFDIQELVVRSFPPGETPERDQRNLRALYKDSLSVAVGSLLRVLMWREKEIESGAHVCRTIECEHSTLAMKHPVSAGARLLLGSTSAEFNGFGTTYPVYVSHPISRPREDKANDGHWPPVVDDLAKVVAHLAAAPVGNCHVVPVMPTAIDEVRLLDDGMFLHPCLAARWPFEEEGMLYSLPEAPEGSRPFAGYDDYEARGLSAVFDPPINSAGRRVGLPLSDPEVSGVLRTLKEATRLQMAGRDHLLVRQCPGFFLYRPLYGKHEFSGGVDSEIRTFDLARKYRSSLPDGNARYISFIHDKQDAAGLFARQEDGLFPDPVRNAASALYSRACVLAEARGKTRAPGIASEDAVASALQATHNFAEVVPRIQAEMFPPPKEGSVGTAGPPPLDQAVTGPLIERTIREERVSSLTRDISHEASYAYAQDDVVYRFPEIAEPSPVTHVDVVEDLDCSEERRLAAAVRARDFFAKAAAPPSL